MKNILDPVMLLNFGVDLLLLLGTAGLSEAPVKKGRIVLGAALGGVYGGLCMIGQFRFLGGFFWRIAMLGVMGWISFGGGVDGLRQTVLFSLLSMALEGMALGLGRETFSGLILGALLLAVISWVFFRKWPGDSAYVQVALCHDGRKEEFLALRDTGNTLKDPVTGEGVLVAAAPVAQRLLGLSPKELENPVQTMELSLIHGLRLIPYRAVGGRGMLLALRIKDARIGTRKGSALVAFAPDVLDPKGVFQALAGGNG